MAVISVRFILRDSVTNTRDYYLLDDKISVTYDVETIYNPLTQKYDAVGEVTIDGYDFVIDSLTKKTVLHLTLNQQDCIRTALYLTRRFTR